MQHMVYSSVTMTSLITGSTTLQCHRILNYIRISNYLVFHQLNIHTYMCLLYVESLARARARTHLCRLFCVCICVYVCRYVSVYAQSADVLHVLGRYVYDNREMHDRLFITHE